ncbi:TPA: hypothetical protein RQK09_001694 [Vibrio vulnificus]|nr:hypothetical protein [Vibrio vulnificus]
MLKKTLLAAAVALASTSAFAAPEWNLDINTNTAAAFSTNVLASQTKQPVLDKTSLDAIVTLKFNNSDSADLALEDAGEIVLTLQGDAEFNADKVAALLSATGAAAAPTAFNGGLLVAGNATSTGLDGATYSKDVAEVAKIFKVDTSGNTVSIRHNLDNGNKRLSIKLADDVASAVGALDYLGVKFDFYDAVVRQAFKLTSGSVASVSLEFGALKDATYSAEPKAKSVFKLEDMFTLKQAALATGVSADKTALVSTTYTQWNNPTQGDIRQVEFRNNTTNQQIYTSDIKVSLVGDFSAVAQKNGALLNASGVAQTGWSLANGVVSAMADDVANAALTNLTYVDLNLPQLFVAADNNVNIEAQEFKLMVQHTGNATYNPYSQEIGKAFIVVRDGLKFDTVTTGTSSSNVIYIRDVSKTLPADGGKIFVTITEYDAHDLENGGKGTDIITRAELPTRLPSNGAVTLTPAGIAAALGVETTPARQARFFFEVETNQGEAAVKKQTAEGVDIQTGEKDAPVDFTL